MPTDFDLAQIALPFRMQPGLQRVTAADCQLTTLQAGSVLHKSKQRVVTAGQAVFCVPGFDPARAGQVILQHAATTGAGLSLTALDWPALAFEEDFALLDGSTGTVPWLCVCAPSHWAPEDKLGQSLAAIHGPVADNAALQAAAAQLVRLVTSGRHWQRFVWSVTPSGHYDQHPRRHPRTPWPATEEPAEFARQCFLRVERQTFLPVPGARQAVFAIRVGLQPLTAAVAMPAQARRLHDALLSMSEAVLHYKGLTPARAPLLQWLSTRF